MSKWGLKEQQTTLWSPYTSQSSMRDITMSYFMFFQAHILPVWINIHKQIRTYVIMYCPTMCRSVNACSCPIYNHSIGQWCLSLYNYSLWSLYKDKFADRHGGIAPGQRICLACTTFWILSLVEPKKESCPTCSSEWIPIITLYDCMLSQI